MKGLAGTRRFETKAIMCRYLCFKITKCVVCFHIPRRMVSSDHSCTAAVVGAYQRAPQGARPGIPDQRRMDPSSTNMYSSQCWKQNLPWSGSICTGAGPAPAAGRARPSACHCAPVQAPGLPMPLAPGQAPGLPMHPAPGQATGPPTCALHWARPKPHGLLEIFTGCKS